MRVENRTKGCVIAITAEMARSFASRGKGLLGRDQLASGEGLIIDPCQSVHSLFMRFPIDVVFLSKSLEVVHIKANMVPYRLSKHVFKARCVVELPAGTAASTGTTVGDRLAFVE
jgi:uncharacterized protein